MKILKTRINNIIYKTTQYNTNMKTNKNEIRNKNSKKHVKNIDINIDE